VNVVHITRHVGDNNNNNNNIIDTRVGWASLWECICLAQQAIIKYQWYVWASVVSWQYVYRIFSTKVETIYGEDVMTLQCAHLYIMVAVLLLLLSSSFYRTAGLPLPSIERVSVIGISLEIIILFFTLLGVRQKF